MKLLLGTGNGGKIGEYRELLVGLPLELVTPREAGINAAIDENRRTFSGNARLKATTLCKRSGLATLADDSGLEVTALHGEPGVRSARYAGPGATDLELATYLLRKMTGVPPVNRAARFRCVVALALPDGRVFTRSGSCRGVIALSPRGDAGFGYDPVFLLPALDLTMAELPPELKNRLSHRGRAARAMRPLLRSLAAEL